MHEEGKGQLAGVDSHLPPCEQGFSGSSCCTVSSRLNGPKASLWFFYLCPPSHQRSAGITGVRHKSALYMGFSGQTLVVKTEKLIPFPTETPLQLHE